MPTTPSTQIYFRAGALAPALDARHDSPGLAAKTLLERTVPLLDREVERLDLSENEWMLVRDATNGWLAEPHTIPLLWAEVADAIAHDGLDRTWGVDGAALVGKLRALSPLQALAVVDATDRWWRQQAEAQP